MNVFRSIRSRREVRVFRHDPVPYRDMLRILDAGRLAPSSKNNQPWHFIVVRDRATLRRLAATTPTGPHLADATFAIAIVANPQARAHELDVGRAGQNMMLAAWELGVGSCWVSNFDDQANSLLGVPADRKLVTVLPFGYPADQPRGRKRRRSFQDVVFAERFGTPIQVDGYVPVPTT